MSCQRIQSTVMAPDHVHDFSLGGDQRVAVNLATAMPETLRGDHASEALP